MVTWTVKAEADYRAKFPGMKCKRIAGQEAKYDGHPIVAGGSVYQAYAMRGWVQDGGKEVKVLEPRLTGNYKIGASGMSVEEQTERWVKLQKLIKDNPDIGIKGLAASLGLKTPPSIYKFIEKYGAGLARKFGKLPKLNNLRVRKDFWRDVMEW